MLKQIPNLLIWATILGTSWGFFFLYIYKHVDYIKHFIWTAVYFFVTAVITSFVFKDHLVRVLWDFTAIPLLILVGVVVVHVALYLYLPGHLQEPKEYFQRYPKRSFLTLDRRRLVSKPMDILAQQVFVTLLVLFLQDGGLTLGQTIIAFAVIFGAVHTPLIFIEHGAWPSWYFTIFAILSAVIFPILIVKVKYGFVYSYIIHWVFYTFTAVGFLLWYGRRQNILKRLSL